MMASIIHGRLRLPAHIRLSVAALVGMVGLVWLLFFALSPGLRPTASSHRRLRPRRRCERWRQCSGRPLPLACPPGRDRARTAASW